MEYTLLYIHLHQKRFSIINYKSGRAEIPIFLYQSNTRLNAKLS